MLSRVKKTVSVFSYDQEKSEAEEQKSIKKKSLSGFRIWLTRRNSIQAYMCVTLNLTNMLQFSSALIMYGGVVWVSYFTCAVIVGVPMITAEIALGHYINNEIKYVWRMCRLGKGILWNCLLSTFVTATICHIYLTILLHLAFQPNQLFLGDYILSNKTGQNCYTRENKSNTFVNIKPKSNYCREGGLYYGLTDNLDDHHKYLYLPNSYLWAPTLYLAAISFVMVLINCKGIRSFEKVTVLFVLMPYLCAVVLAMLIFTIPGAVNFIGHCWNLDWYKLRDFSVWFVSFKTMVKGFSIGSLGLIFVSVHSDYSDDIMIDVVILFLNIILNSLLNTITLLGLVGVIDVKMKLLTVKHNFIDYLSILMKVITGLSELPPPKWLWKFLFYSYLIGSTLAQQTLLVASVTDVVISLVPKFKTNKFYVTTGLCIIFFLLGICVFSMEVLKTPTLDLTFVTIGFLQSITLFWIYNYERVCTDFHFLMGYKPSLFYQFIWVISPIMFLGVIVSSIILETHMDLVNHNNLYLTILHISIYVICAIVQVIMLWKKKESVNIFQADKSWGPTDPLLKQSRIIFKSRIITKEHIYRQKLYEQQLVKPADITDQNIVQLL